MSPPFRHAALVGKFNAGIRDELESVGAFLVAHGLQVSLEEETAANTGIERFPRLAASRFGEACDIAVVVGGDGTMLGIARQLARQGTPLVGINQGRLGFITDIALGDYESALAPILRGEFDEEQRVMLEGGVQRGGATIFDSVALNDVIVSRGATAGMVELRIEIDGEFVANLRADGLIVGSPTGSTAYALSAGGPIVHPRIAGWALVPIAPHDLANRPIVVPDDGEVAIEIVAGRDASVNFDMQSLTSLMHGDRITVRRSAHKVRFLHPRGWSYFATLRRKLHWAGRHGLSTAMLQRLAIRDFVIVDALELDLAAGLTVLTGETGAGKSILVDALQLALGGRGDAGVVREGAARAEITAEFDVPPALVPWLAEAGFDADAGDAGRLLVRRTIDAQGKSRAWINGSGATVAQLREAGEQLVDIHGQHAWQSLTRAASVRGVLDAYARLDTRALGERWSTWRAALQTLEAASGRQGELERERERLTWQIAEVDKLAPGADEWPELDAEHTRLAHAQSLLDAAREALDAVAEADASADVLAGRAVDALERVVSYDAALAGPIEALRGAQAALQDAAHGLGSYLDRVDLDPARLQALDERMSAWVGLARRFRRPPAELPALLDDWKREAGALDAAGDLEALQASVDAARAAFDSEAKRVTAARKKAAPELSAAVSRAMQQLGMAGGRFEVALEKLDSPLSYGNETTELLVAGHAGTTPRPLAKVASGGELSRIALAVAVVTSELDAAGSTPGTLIFDEVDAGIGGAVAETVGRLMKQLGQGRQVLAVTHLPQVAACADHHLVVSKRSAAGKTLSGVGAVAGEARVGEIARMLGGEKLSSTSLAHAQEMLASGAEPSAAPPPKAQR